MTTEQHISRMENNLEKLTEEIEEVKGMMHQVKEAIMGNPVSGDGGLAARIKKLEDRVAIHDNLRWWIIGAATTAGFSIGELIDKFLMK